MGPGLPCLPICRPLDLVVEAGYAGGASFDVWDLATSKVQHTAMAPYDQYLDGTGLLTPDGKSMVYRLRSQGAVIYDLATGKPAKAIEADPDLGRANAMALAPDGKTLALGTKNGAIIVYDLEKGKVRHTLQPEPLPRPGPPLPGLPTPKYGSVNVLAFAPDNKTLAAFGSRDRKVDLWDTGTGKNIDFLRLGTGVAPQALAFSPDGKTLAFGGNHPLKGSAVALWDLAAGGFRADFDGMGPAKGSAVEFLAFSADGKTLVAAGDYKPIDFWDVPQGKCKATRPSEPTPEQQKAPGTPP